MIDAENEIFSTVATAVRAAYTGIFMTGEETPVPPKFPCVTLIEQDNSTYTKTLDSPISENHAQILYDVNVYSNLASGKKSQAKAIIALIDTEMQKLGFIRIGKKPAEAPNADKTIYRLFGRYKAIISSDLTVYRG